MSLALDVSAGTGKNLDTVVRALSRAVGPDGTTGALERLAPAIKGASDPLAELERLFKGSAEAAAQLDPYQRFNVALGEVSESVGRSLQPALDSLADWFIDVQPDIESFLSKLTGALKDPEVESGIKNMQTALGNLGFTIGALFGSTQTDEAKGFTNFWIVLSGIIENLANLFSGLLAPIAAVLGNTKPMENFLDNVLNSVVGIVNSITGVTPRAATPGTTGGRSNGARNSRSGDKVTININKGNVSAKEVAKAINKRRKTTGSPSINSSVVRPV
jgi:phage-related minor tail protein